MLADQWYTALARLSSPWLKRSLMSASGTVWRCPLSFVLVKKLLTKNEPWLIAQWRLSVEFAQKQKTLWRAQRWSPTHMRCSSHSPSSSLIARDIVKSPSPSQKSSGNAIEKKCISNSETACLPPATWNAGALRALGAPPLATRRACSMELC